MNLRKTAISTAMTAAMGLGMSSASAGSLSADWTGWFTMLNPAGTAALANGDAAGQAYYGWRTAVNGTMTFDTTTGAGSATVQPFSFFAAGNATATAITMQSIGGGLVLGNMGFNWGGTTGIPVSLVLDASGFFGAVAGGLSTSDTISGVGALPATDGQLFGAKLSYTLPLGPAPMATTTFNTTDITTITVGVNPSGTLPLTDDGIGGSPMKAGPFPLFNAKFDIMSVHVTNVDTGEVPVPAAVWLFGSGLLGLVGVARRRKNA
mgnify:FL=1